MSVIGHYLEDEGIPTVSISLVRLHTETIRPPRALWVPFELGRPLGAPHESGLQSRVLQTMLRLLERTDGPAILEDFGEDAPKANDEEMLGMFCPLAKPEPLATDAMTNHDAVRLEIDDLSPWYEMALQRSGARTTFGASTLSLKEVLNFLFALARREPASAAPGKTLGQTMRLAAEDLRAWYGESRIAHPGANPDSATLANWFWGETAAGRLLLNLYSIGIEHEDASVVHAAKNSLIPRNQQHRIDAR